MSSTTQDSNSSTDRVGVFLSIYYAILDIADYGKKIGEIINIEPLVRPIFLDREESTDEQDEMPLRKRVKQSDQSLFELMRKMCDTRTIKFCDSEIISRSETDNIFTIEVGDRNGKYTNIGTLYEPKIELLSTDKILIKQENDEDVIPVTETECDYTNIVIKDLDDMDCIQEIKREVMKNMTGFLPTLLLESLTINKNKESIKKDYKSSKHSNDPSLIGHVVMCLPVAFTGGAFKVSYSDEQVEIEFEDMIRNNCKKMKLNSKPQYYERGRIVYTYFYKGCEMKIRPVDKGHQVVITLAIMKPESLVDNTPTIREQDIARNTRKFVKCIKQLQVGTFGLLLGENYDTTKVNENQLTGFDKKLWIELERVKSEFDFKIIPIAYNFAHYHDKKAEGIKNSVTIKDIYLMTEEEIDRMIAMEKPARVEQTIPFIFGSTRGKYCRLNIVNKKKYSGYDHLPYEKKITFLHSAFLITRRPPVSIDVPNSSST
ncbi:mannan endo-1,4-beta-mannosidase [Acrasis kona]|uniref:Mannan endo-1,4-beta-mannosidase n=1 Tax=Acrasis kona TaxID=1008807 RepID=A0AAW2Z8H2_9EUKA